jgi:hypothetical protein
MFSIHERLKELYVVKAELNAIASSRFFPDMTGMTTLVEEEERKAKRAAQRATT